MFTKCIARLVVAATGAVLLAGCGRAATSPGAANAAQPRLDAQTAATLQTLQQELARQLAAAGEPGPALPRGRGAWPAPLDHDLDWDETAPDRLPVVQLFWREALPGDLDTNGRVDSADLLPLARYWGYDLPRLQSSYDGFTDDFNAFDELPEWFDRADSNHDEILNFADLRSIAVHYGQQLDGYRVYRRAVGTQQWELLPDPQGESAALTLPRARFVQPIAGNGGLRAIPGYSYNDDAAPGQQVEYRVVPYDSQLQEEGQQAFPFAVNLYTPSELASRFGLTSEGTYRNVPTALLDLNTRVYPADRYFLLNTQAERDLYLSGPIAYPATLDIDYGADGSYDSGLQLAGVASRLTLQFPALGEQAVRVRLTDAQGAVSYHQEIVEVRSQNRPPVLRVTVQLPSAAAPVAYCRFDTSGSYDPDGDTFSIGKQLVSPSGDVETNQTYHLAILRESGQYQLTVTATDGFGASTVVTRGFTLGQDTQQAPGWELRDLPLELEKSDFIPLEQEFSAATIGGRPFLAARQGGAWQLLRASDALGQSWPDATGLQQISAEQTPAGRVLELRLLDVGGFPAAHAVLSKDDNVTPEYDGFLRAEDSAGAQWGEIRRLGPEGREPGLLQVVGGKPALIYGRTKPTEGIYFLQASDSLGRVWPAAGSLAVETPYHSQRGIQLFDYAGTALLSYVARDRSLTLARATGPASWQVLPPSGLFAAEQLLLRPAPGGPQLLALSYVPGPTEMDPSELQLFASDGGGFTFGAGQGVPGMVNWTTGHALIIQQRPLLVYHDQSSLELVLVAAADSAATAWEAPVVIDGRDECGAACALLEVGGQPAVVYTVVGAAPGDISKSAAPRLRYARRSE